MNILILGNGFDLAHHLPTCYDDFLGFAQRILYIYTWRENFAEYVDTHINKWDNASEYLKKQLRTIFTQRKSEGTCKYNAVVKVNDNIDAFRDCLENNVWYRYFISISTTSSTREEKLISGGNWIDFENEMSFVIQYLDNEYKSLDERIFIDNVINVLYSKTKEKAANTLEYINNKKLFQFYRTCRDHCKDIIANGNGTKLRDLRDRLYNDLEKLICAFDFYLTEFVDKIPITKLSFVENITPERVISFNYTNTFERLYSVLTSDKHILPHLPKICHVHGECAKPGDFPEENDIVIGIDEYLETPDEQSKRTNFAVFKKFIQRIRKGNNIDYISWTKEIDTAYRNSKGLNTSLVYIFGHSLNITDKEILEPILKSNATYLHIYAKNKASEGALISNLLMLIGRDAVMSKSAEGKIIFERIEGS